jgi:hypothetical protein
MTTYKETMNVWTAKMRAKYTQNFPHIISDHTLHYTKRNLDLHTHTPPEMFIHFLNTLLILFNSYMRTNTGMHRLFVTGNTTSASAILTLYQIFLFTYPIWSCSP